MPSPRLLSAAFLSATLALSACGAGSGEHNVPDEGDQQTTADSAAAGTDIPSTLPPAGTVNPATPAGTGTSSDSAAGGQTQGATPGSPNPATPIQSGAASDSAR